jgi:hypothetical protein
LPTKTLRFSTPHFALFGKVPSYAHIRVFGCKCCPNLLATTPHKLAPGSTLSSLVTRPTIKDTGVLMLLLTASSSLAMLSSMRHHSLSLQQIHLVLPKS